MKQTHVSDEKRRRIIRAAMETFAKNGYKNATMDDIVAGAGISKGLIYHYFGSKRKLYLYLYEFAYGIAYEHITTMLSTAHSDLFERIRQTERAKLEVMSQYPYMLDFLTSARREKDAQLQEDINKLKGERFSDWSPAFLSGVDISKLRDGVDVGKVIKIILWCTEGLFAENKDNFVLEELFDQMDVYLEMMRRAFYKEKYL